MAGNARREWREGGGPTLSNPGFMWVDPTTDRIIASIVYYGPHWTVWEQGANRGDYLSEAGARRQAEFF